MEKKPAAFINSDQAQSIKGSNTYIDVDMRLIFIFFLLSGLKVFPQLADSTTSTPKTENYFSFRYDNDFFSATDRYYTQGIQVNLIHPVVRYSPFSYALIRLSRQALNYYGLQLQQDVFTPVSIRHEGIFYGERPFTAVFFVSHSLVSIHTAKKTRLETQLDLGIMGPNAKGEEEQKGIHKALDNIEPLGWENQLAQDIVVNYRASLEKGLIMKNNFELMGAGVGRVGTLYTDLGVCLNARLGIFSPYFNNLGLENDPAKRKNKFKIYGFAKAGARAVVYNATLQGGLINQSSVYTLPASDVTRLVAECLGGIVIAYKRVSLEYSKAYITPEFKNGVDHGWGKCVITVCF
ncbi:MAG: lipid A deacylase LpxR family protein [Bacteroidota bacterium]